MPNYKYKTIPYKHQEQAFYSAYDKEYYALFLDPGLGKSKVSIDIASNLYLEKKINAVLCIAPNGVHQQWYNEQIPEHSPVETERFLWNPNRTKRYLLQLKNFLEGHSTKLKWFCVNVEAFQGSNHLQLFKNFCKYHNTMVVIDEATRIKNPEANRTDNLIYRINEITMFNKKITKFVYTSKYRLILTGMMVTNSPFDLYAFFTFLKYNFYPYNYFTFKNVYGILVKDTNNSLKRTFMRSIRPEEVKSIRKQHNEGVHSLELAAKFNISENNIQYILNNENVFSSYKNLDKLKEIIKPFSFIARKSDCLDLPPKIYEKIFVEMNPKQKELYQKLRKEMVAEFGGKELSVANKMVLAGRLQQITGGFFPYMDTYVTDTGEEIIVKKESKALPITENNPKIEAILADYEEAGDDQLLIWSRYTAEIKAIIEILRKQLPYKRIEGYFGEIKSKERDEYKEAYQHQEIDILVLNPQCGSEGLNLQVSHLVYYFSNYYSLEKREQSEDRIHRIGQQKTCLYKDLICKGTVDEKIYNVLAERKELWEYFRDVPIEEVL